jgi:hypothetical protein
VGGWLWLNIFCSKVHNKDPDLNIKVSNTFYTVVFFFFFGFHLQINNLQFEIDSKNFMILDLQICVLCTWFMFGHD